MKNQDTLEPRKDHIWLRVIAFAAALVIAVAGITNGVLRFGHKDAGFQKIEPTQEEEAAKQAARGLEFQYYFDGSSDEIKRAVKELGALYSPTVQRVSQQLNAETVYDELNNIAALNAHIGEDLSVSEELYRVLIDALEKTREEKGYNVFAGALNRSWEQLRYLADPENFDPLRNEEQRGRLERLTAATNDRSRFSLTVVDEATHKLRFEVADSYLALLRELEYEGPILDLGVLHDAYELQLLGAAMEQAGYHRGYISTKTGTALLLSDCPELELNLLGLADGDVSPAVKAAGRSGCGVCEMRVFAAQEDEGGYYQLDGVYRHPWLPASGAWHNLLLSALIRAEDPVTACYLALQLQNCAEQDELLSLIAGSDAEIAFILNNGEKRVLANSEGFLPREDYGWTLESIPG